jgi:hypothetical protein
LETVGIWLALLIALAVVAAGLYWRLMYLFKKNIV